MKSYKYGFLMLIGISLIIPGMCRAQDRLENPRIEERFSAAYRMKMQKDEPPYLHYETIIKKQIDGNEVYILYAKNSKGGESEIVLEAKELRPVYTAQFDKGKLVCRINYLDKYADIFIPKEKAEESQALVPKVFRKWMALFDGKKDRIDRKDIEKTFTPEELAEMKSDLPMERLLKGMFINKAARHVKGNISVPSKNRDTEKRIELPENLYSVQALGTIVLSGFPFEKKKKVTFNLSMMPHPLVIWKMTVTHLGEEDITVPAGTFRCYKLAMETNEWWRFFAFNADNTYIWVRKDPPHYYVKYTYPFAGHNVELLSYTPESQDIENETK